MAAKGSLPLQAPACATEERLRARGRGRRARGAPPHCRHHWSMSVSLQIKPGNARAAGDGASAGVALRREQARAQRGKVAAATHARRPARGRRKGRHAAGLGHPIRQDRIKHTNNATTRARRAAGGTRTWLGGVLAARRLTLHQSAQLLGELSNSARQASGRVSKAGRAGTESDLERFRRTISTLINIYFHIISTTSTWTNVLKANGRVWRRAASSASVACADAAQLGGAPSEGRRATSLRCNCFVGARMSGGRGRKRPCSCASASLSDRRRCWCQTEPTRKCALPSRGDAR